MFCRRKTKYKLFLSKEIIGIVFFVNFILDFRSKELAKIFMLTDICRPLVLFQKVFVMLRYN